MPEQVGPVIMSHPVARAKLESSGVVTSFRTSERTTGESHYRYERTGCKQGDVVIERVSDEIEPEPGALTEHRPASGFSTVRDWIAAIEKVHGGLESGYVYRVELVEDPREGKNE